MQDLESHTLLFAQAIRNFVRALPRTLTNAEDAKQLLRASGAIGEAYISAKQSVNKYNFTIELKNCFKEIKITRHWLQLIDTQGHPELETQRKKLMAALEELGTVFGNLLSNAQQ